MKIKMLTRLSAAMLLGAFAAGCTDEVPAIPSEELYTREFVKRFGNVDKEHTWNIAVRGDINVTVDRPSRVLVSGIINGKRYLLGDFAGVDGTRALNFDMPVGCTDLRVTDGRQEIYTKVGSRVSFADNSRVIYEHPDHDVVKVTRTDYHTFSDKLVRGFGEYLPEGDVNLGKVTQNFSFVANGPFTIYPVFWQTVAWNTIGIYYDSGELDESGNPKLVHVPIFTIRKKAEGETDSSIQYRVDTEVEGCDAAWIEGSGAKVYSYNFEELYGFKCDWGQEPTEEQYAIFKAKYIEQNKQGPGYGVDKWEGTSYDETAKNALADQRLLDDIEYTYNSAESCIEITKFHFTAVEPLTIEGTWTNALGTCTYVEDGKYQSYVDKVKAGMAPEDALAEVFGANAPSIWRSRGIHIDVKAGTKFGMYLCHDTSEPTGDFDITIGNDANKELFYSEAELNRDHMWYEGVYQRCVHASTYMTAGNDGVERRVLGFEDWENAGASESNPDSRSSDLDLNDMIFFIDSDDPGMIPNVVDDDPGEELKWIVACEDLGNLDDFDFNDVVFQVRHVSGREQAYITPLAAGGTLETYLHYVDANGNDRVFGDAEWHEHFGVYDHTQMINTRGSITHTARERSITVGTDFTLSPIFHDAAGNQFGTTEFKQNMGGMYISVVRANGTRDDITPPTRSGEAPQMFLIPQAYNKFKGEGNYVPDDNTFNYKWLWPIERHAIELAYPRFTDWIKDSNNNADWHLTPNTSHVVNR